MEEEQGEQLSYLSPWKVLETGSSGKAVVCPVCKNLLDLKTWTKDMLVQHMTVHNMHMTDQWRRACQFCIDRGDPFTRIGPEQLLSHLRSVHETIDPAPQQPPTKDTAPEELAPLPQQPAEPATAPAFDTWKYIKRNGGHWVVCPFCPFTNLSMKAKNIVKHVKKVHPCSDVCTGFKQILCQGCKVPVPPEQVVHHIVCQPPNTTADEASKKMEARRCGYGFIAAHKSRVRRSRGKPVKCHVNGCDKTFLKANLGDHLRLVHSFPKLQCNIVPDCTHQSLSVSSFAQHVKRKLQHMLQRTETPQLCDMFTAID